MLQSKNRSGERDYQITFLQKSVSVGTANSDYLGAWTSVASNPTVWARKRELKGSEVVVADRVTFVQNTVFNVQYRTDITVENRILCNSKHYQIISIQEVSRRTDLDIVCALLDTLET